MIIEDKQEFAKKLADLYFIDSWVSRAVSSNKDSIKTKLSKDFKELYGLSVEEFHLKLAELKNDPTTYGEIMDSVNVILNNKGKIKN